MLSGAPHALPQHTCALCAHQFTEKGDAAFRLSGIVSIMFCGMVMAKYVRPNLSRSTDDRVGAFFRVIASLAEIFVFVYIGCALFTEQQAWDKPSTWMFILWSLVALAVSRYLNVYPSTAFINMLRPHEQHIPDNHKHMLWFSGLRGAMAFALAMLANSEFKTEASEVVLTSTFFMVRRPSFLLFSSAVNRAL